MEICDECQTDCYSHPEIHVKRDGSIERTRGLLITCKMCENVNFCYRCKSLRCEDLKDVFSVFKGPSTEYDRMKMDTYTVPGGYQDVSAKPIKIFKNYNWCLQCSLKALGGDDFKRRLLGFNGGRRRGKSIGKPKQLEIIFNDLTSIWEYQLKVLPNVLRAKNCLGCGQETHISNSQCKTQTCYGTKFERPYQSSQNRWASAFRN